MRDTAGMRLRRNFLTVLLTAGTIVAIPIVPSSPAGAAASGSFTALSPARILDTRLNGVTVDNQAMREGVLGPNSSRTLHVTGRAGVPASGVDAVVLNVTAVDQTLPTFITVWPTGIVKPGTSNLNPTPGITAPNLVIAKVGSGGNIDLYNSTGTVNLIADIAGWFAPGSTYTPITPARIMDSRNPDGHTDDGLAQGGGVIAAGQTVSLQVTGRLNVPNAGVGAVAINITAADQTADTFVTAFPSDSVRTNTSNLNPKPGIVAPNMAVVKVGSDGKIKLYNDQGSTNLIVDVVGWFPLGLTFTPLTPARLLDTRAGATTIDGIGAGVGNISPSGVRTMRVAGRAGVPLTGVSAVILNVTAIGQTSPSFITAFPAGQPRPNSSNLNPTPGITAPNLVVAKVGPNGDVSLYNSSGTVNLIVDIAGWFSGDALQSNSLNRIAAGQNHTCAITSAATVSCVGSNQYGQLGQPLTVLSSATPAVVPGLTDVVSIESGSWTTCAVLGDSSVKCWGRDRALGTGSTVNSPTPTSVPFLSGVVSLSTDYLQTCALTVSGTVYCWGDNSFGAVGPGFGAGVARVPVAVPGVAGAVQVSVGTYASCAVINDGSVKCWGDSNPTPTTVGGLGSVVGISLGTVHRCVVFANGGAACQGQNGAGQLGQVGPTSAVYVGVPGVTGAVGVEAGQYHTCVWTTTGTARCWGGNLQGEVGDGTGVYATADYTADLVAGLSFTTITEISASNQSCAATQALVNYCWGFNETGTLGFPADALLRQSFPQPMLAFG
jgi:alpha-tubulin suppressor-like RCC1 family protein